MSVDALAQLLVATLGAAAVGLERQWSSQVKTDRPHFAGLRTFTLIGGAGGLAGLFWTAGFTGFALIITAAAAGVIVAAYVSASRRDVDGTTEMAAIVTLAAALLAGTGRTALASGVFASVTLLLAEKTRLHTLVARIDDESLRAAARFAVMAVVILPLLPAGPFGPFGGVRPRELWVLVLFFSGLNFAGYVARRLVGPAHGYVLSGLLGGLLSSTSVTLTFSRASRAEPAAAQALAGGVVAASTVLFPRVAIATLVLNPSLTAAVVPYLVAPFIVGAAVTLVGLRRASDGAVRSEPPRNPLGFVAAVQMALMFQLVLFVMHFVQHRWGSAGLMISAAVLGLTDVDALTLSMSRQAASGVDVQAAARALTIGILSNTTLKLLIALVVGERRFRVSTTAGFAAMLVAGALSLVIWWR